MGVPVMIMGASGSGKSASLRNFEPDEIGILNVAGKPLPFRKPLKVINLPQSSAQAYSMIDAVLKAHKSKRYVIDDSQYLLSFEMFEKASVQGYKKFTDLAIHFYSLIQACIRQTPPDCIVYFLHHSERVSDGTETVTKVKTIGKMLDEKLTIEGLFSIVLYCKAASGGRHVFITQSDGTTTAKSPMDMFESEVIDNDLKKVDEAIRKYYDFN